MTAQVIVSNLNGVALSSDKLVTITSNSGVRTIDGHSKLFRLSSPHKIAIAISGSIELNGMPIYVLFTNWEKTLDKPLETVSQYVISFLSWVEENQKETGFLNERQLELSLLSKEFETWDSILATYLLDWLNDVEGKDVLKTREFEASILEYLDLYMSTNEWGYFRGISQESVFAYAINEYKDEFDSWFESMEEKFLVTLSDDIRSKIELAVSWSLSRMGTTSQGLTNLVFAGFGSGQFTPEIARFSTQGVYMGQMQCQPFSDSISGPDQFYFSEGGYEEDFASFPSTVEEPVYIFTAAQDSHIIGFLSGIDSMVLEVLTEPFEGLLKQALGEAGIKTTKTQRVEIALGLDSIVEERFIESAELRMENLKNAVSIMKTHELGSFASSLLQIQTLANLLKAQFSTVGNEVETITIDAVHGVVDRS